MDILQQKLFIKCVFEHALWKNSMLVALKQFKCKKIKIHSIEMGYTPPSGSCANIPKRRFIIPAWELVDYCASPLLNVLWIMDMFDMGCSTLLF